jgi:NAD(P)-dependent dehydrogenase (short-subunit alcohol dehydrogenase family)
MGTVEEIAEAVVWLASPAAGYVTGCLLDARGGF